MTRSYKQTGSCKYYFCWCCDRDALPNQIVHHNRAHRKKLRDAISQTPKTFDEQVMENLTLQRMKHVRKSKYFQFYGEPREDQVDCADYCKDYLDYVDALKQSKKNLKAIARKDKFEEWCEARPSHVVKKKRKQLKREDRDSIFDDDSTDSETEKELEKWRNKNYSHEAAKYYETCSMKVLKAYRRSKHK
ncbi:hypothetical protein C9374_000821 [Naegleria lovaniensis]|uniref:Uncharacterized protein n=1 Tax=Naegleria lovaniensis TaxID=51637 RepID=A0AA88KNU5_NAELO|nr:uncharacterized protein C9374_000821 [Naegleria lovaniensis]KAG2387971.1 hypothetical protein C9374_000821 [Naegleria lovaniensis]